MKLIEALKRVKANDEKIEDLREKIQEHCSYNSLSTPVYGEKQPEKVNSWLQSCLDLSQENVSLWCKIQKTNLETDVTIDICGEHVTKSIAAWILRRREYANKDFASVVTLKDNCRDGVVNIDGNNVKVTVVRCYDPEKRDELKNKYRTELSLIDSALEIANATTDLIEG